MSFLYTEPSCFRKNPNQIKQSSTVRTFNIDNTQNIKLRIVIDSADFLSFYCSCARSAKSSWCSHLAQVCTHDAEESPIRGMDIAGNYMIPLYGFPYFAIPTLIFPIDKNLYKITALIKNAHVESSETKADTFSEIGYTARGQSFKGVRQLLLEWVPSILDEVKGGCNSTTHAVGDSPLDKRRSSQGYILSSLTESEYRTILRDAYCLLAFDCCVNCYMTTRFPF